MLSLFSPDLKTDAPAGRRLAWYGLFLIGMMVALWVVSRTVAMPSSDSDPQSSQVSDSTAAAASPGTQGGGEIEVFTWGNATAVLLLLGGGGLALYLRRQKGETSPSTPFRRLGKLGLGPSKHIQLVACGGEVLLLSATEDEISLLKTYSQDAFEEDELQMGDGAPSAAPPAPSPTEWSGSFADVLNRFADRPPQS